MAYDKETEWLITHQLREQQDIWDSVTEQRYLARMDKKPSLVYGPKFIKDLIPLPPFTVEPFFPNGGLAVLHGKRTAGKSLFCMTLTKSIATGKPFLGMFKVARGNVVYIQLDMIDSTFQDRLKDREANQFEDWYVMTGVANFGNSTQDTPWVEAVNAIDPDLIIIDTLRKAHNRPEKDSDTVAWFYTKLRDLFGYKSILMVHHDRKTSTDGSVEGGNEDFRGSGAWMDDADVGLHLRKSKKDGIVLEFSKVRTFDEDKLEDIPLRINKDSLHLELDDSKLTKTTRARMWASAHMKDNPQTDQRGLSSHLFDSYPDLSKSQASIAAKEFFHTSV